MKELEKGGSAADLQEWAESQNNLKAAQRHFATRLAIEARELARQVPSERRGTIREWLETAAANALYVKRRLGDTELQGRIAPTERWLDIFDSVCEQ